MAQDGYYYLIPLDRLPVNPSYELWFATWSLERPIVEWSVKPPLANPDGVSAWTVGVGVTADDLRQSPQNAEILGAVKDGPPPPMSLQLTISPRNAGIPGFVRAFADAALRGD